MSWHYLNEDLEPCTYSPEQGEESLLMSYLDTFPSALSKLTPMHAAFSSHASGTDYYQGSLFGTTCKPLMDTDGGEKSTSLQGDFHARIYQQLIQREKELKAIEAGSGRKWEGSFAKLSPDMSSWKIPHFSLFEEYTSFCETWPRWGIMLNGECWERTPADFPIIEPEFGWLPTPSGVNRGKNHTMGRVDEWGGSSKPIAGIGDWGSVIAKFRGDRYGLADRVDRTDCARNGQVPIVASTAWTILR